MFKSLSKFDLMVRWVGMSALLMLSSFQCTRTHENTGTAGAHGGKLVAAIAADADVFNPILYQTAVTGDLLRLMFLPTLRYDQDFKLQTADKLPCLVQSWRFSEDFLEVTLFLKDGLKWSDGQPVTARDIAFTYTQMKDPGIPYPSRSQLDFVEKCAVVNDLEITFKFKEVYANELDDLTFMVLPAHVFEKVSATDFINHPFNQNPTVVSGHYRLKTWMRGQQIELEANPACSFSPPKLDRLIFRIIPDQSARLTNLKSGEIDLVSALPALEVTELKQNPNLEVKIYTGSQYDYIGWLNTHPLFKDREVRRAMTMAINRQQLIAALYYGFAHECVGSILPVQKEFFNTTLQPLPYNPEAAKKILAAKGWKDSDGDGILDKDGQKFSFKLKTNINTKQRVDAVTMIQADLQKIGVEVIPDIVEFNVMVQQQSNKDYEALISGLRLAPPFDPTGSWHSKEIKGGFNYACYSSATVDSLIDLGRQTLDSDKARAIWYQFQEVLYADQPVTFLYLRDNIDAVNKKFKGIVTSPRGIYYNIYDWYIEEATAAN